jgi:hypothetical protein
MVAERWPRSAALGLLGLLVFGWAFAAGQIARSQTPVPVNVAVLCVVAAGALLVLTHRARWRDVLAGVVLMYTSAAFIFYFSLL